MRVAELFRRQRRIRKPRKPDVSTYENDIDLAMLAPTAARLVAGSITLEEAHEMVSELASNRPTAEVVWRTMSPQERVQLGRDFVTICATPRHNASIGKLSYELREANPSLWEQAVEAGKNGSELSPVGKRLLFRISGLAAD